MRFQIEATPTELKQKSMNLVRQLSHMFAPVAPELSEILEKALPRKEQALKYPVLRALQKQTRDLYQEHLDRMVAEISEVLDESTETTFLQKSLEEEIELPASFVSTFFRSAFDDLEKARTHKYIRRVPYMSGGKRKYRYYYKVTGGKGLGAVEEIKLQAKFKVVTEDAEGHLTVLKIQGEQVTVEHDETGEIHVFNKKALQKFLHRQHAKEIEQRRKKIDRMVEAAKEHGTEKQQAILEQRQEQFEETFKPDEPTALAPFQAAVEKLIEPAPPLDLEDPNPEPVKEPIKDLARLKPEEIPEKRFGDDEAIEKLQQMGDALYDAQDRMHDVQDDTGFNSSDFQIWYGVRGDLEKMRWVLRKYRRQLCHSFGLDYYHCGLSDPPKATGVKPQYHKTFGSLLLPVNGRIDREAFRKYVALQKEFGARFDGRERTWYIPKGDLADFDFDEYRARMIELGIDVAEPAEIPPKQEKEGDGTVKDLTATEVKEGILRRQIKNTIAVIRYDDGKFAFYSPYSPEFNQLFSNKTGQLSGITKYNPENHGRETYDLDLVEEAIEKIKARLPDFQIVTEGVKEARIERDQYLAELQKPIPEVQEKLAPGFNLFPYQNECVRFLDETGGNALIGDEMGLGKTLQTLAWAAKNNKKILVVCPKVVRRTWLQEAAKFFPEHFQGTELTPAMLRKKGKIDLGDSNIVTVNFESLAKFKDQISEAGFDTIVVDESHRIKNPKAKVTKTVQAVAKDMKHKILLSGTAIKNKREELTTQLNLVAPGEYTKEKIKGSTIGGLWMDLRDIYLARLKSIVLKDLPDKTTQIMEQPVAGLPDLDLDLPAEEMIGQFSRLKDEIARGKVSATKEVVKEILNSSDSRVLVFSDSVQAAKDIAAQFGDQAVLHHGQMGDNARENVKAEFQKQDDKGEFVSEKRVFVTTRQSMAVGATLTAADKVVFNDLPWTAADLRQAEDRVHRPGQKNAVNVYWVTAEGNLFDANINAILLRKYELAKKVNQGKQLTPEEVEWMNKRLTPKELLDQIRGLQAGPEAHESSQIEEEAEKSLSASSEEKSLLIVGKSGNWGKAAKTAKEYHDHTAVPAEQDRIAYARVKQILKRRGYVDADFEEGGPLYGYSTNQLLKLIRGKE